MNKRRIFLVAVALGVVLGAGIALWRVGRSEKGEECPKSNVQSPTSNVVAVVDRGQKTEDKEIVTNAVKFVAVTNVAANVQPPKSPKLPKPPKPITTYVPNVPKARQVLLANRRIVIEKGRSFPKKFCATQTPTARGTAPYIVISEIPVSRDVRIQAVADGAKVIGFLPNNALLVEADATALKNLEDDAMFLAAVEYEPTDKIQPALHEAVGGEEKVEGRDLAMENAENMEKVEATVVLLNETDRETVSAFVTANGGKMIAGTPTKGKAITAEIPTSLVTDLAKKAEVKWIEKHGRLKLLNDQAVLPQVMNVTPVWNTHGLTGEGQIIASLDSGIDNGSTTDINADFKDKIVDIIQMSDGNYKDYTGHGTHTAGSLVGTGANSSGQFKGVAHGAKLCVLSASGSDHTFDPEFDPMVESTLIDLFITGLDKWKYGVKSDSWGSGGDAYGMTVGYDEYCVACDKCIWNHPELLEVFAAGNDGYNENYTIDSPASAKNVLAVGSTLNRRPDHEDVKTDEELAHVSSFSSLGPTSDGRIKPDICAPGEYVVSVLSANAYSGAKFETNKKYHYMSGTSMATPLTAGCAALVREWLMKRRGYSETKPTAALMKAILTGGATDIYNKDDIWSHIERPVPSNYQGWGRVDLEASIFPTNGLAVYLKDRLPFETGATFSFTVVTTNAASLRAQLVWIDHAAEQEAGPMINNNLDLTVSNSEIGTLYGNGGTAADELNTVESVRIESAAAGRYIVKVTCPTIPYDYTEGGAAAIYIRGAFDPASVEYDDTPDPVMMYFNRLAGSERVTSGAYGEKIVVPDGGYCATHFAARTKIANGASEPERGGNYTNIIQKIDGDTDIQSHKVAGWFKVDKMPASGENNVTAFYLARAYDGDHGGYKAAVDSTGAICVGKINNVGWNTKDSSSILKSASAQIEAGKWYHLGVAVTKDASARKATVRVFVNGVEIAMSSGYVKTNLNGNECTNFEIGTGVSAAGIFVDKGVLTKASQFVRLATDETYVARPAPSVLYITRHP